MDPGVDESEEMCEYQDNIVDCDTDPDADQAEQRYQKPKEWVRGAEQQIVHIEIDAVDGGASRCAQPAACPWAFCRF